MFSTSPDRGPRLAVAACLLVAISAGAMVACGADPDLNASTGLPASPGTARSGPSPGAAAPGPVEDYEATEADFRNLKTMTPVRGFFVDNKLGHLDEAVALAEANQGGEYPVGTILQLVPQEAMVKRREGWNPASKDWEFFFMDVDADGTTIAVRGGDEVVNRFGGNCASCHAAADDKYDFVCETDHGCEPLPIERPIIDAIQASDPRQS